MCTDWYLSMELGDHDVELEPENVVLLRKILDFISEYCKISIN